MVTIGQRRLGRKIRNLETSVELSSKVSKRIREKVPCKSETASAYTEDSPIQNLRDFNCKQKDTVK